jgi:hypothetical protein
MDHPKLPSIHLWQYAENRRNYPGVHFTADERGCAQLHRAIATSIEESDSRPYVTVQLSPPTAAALSVPNNRSSAALPFQKLRLQMVRDAEPETLEISVLESVCNLRYSKDMAARLTTSVQEVAKGRGDFSIGGKDPNVIWFWWHLAEPQEARELSK